MPPSEVFDTTDLLFALVDELRKEGSPGPISKALYLTTDKEPLRTALERLAKEGDCDAVALYCTHPGSPMALKLCNDDKLWKGLCTELEWDYPEIKSEVLIALLLARATTRRAGLERRKHDGTNRHEHKDYKHEVALVEKAQNTLTILQALCATYPHRTRFVLRCHLLPTRKLTDEKQPVWEFKEEYAHGFDAAGKYTCAFYNECVFFGYHALWTDHLWKKSSDLPKLPAGFAYQQSFQRCILPTVHRPAWASPRLRLSLPDRFVQNHFELETVDDMDGIEYIGRGAFKGCKKLRLQGLPKTLGKIGREAFAYCSSLALTELPSKLDWIDPFAFYECKSLALTKIAVENILKGAFLCCTALAPKAITCDVLYIGRAAFRGCTSLGRIELWRDCDDNCNLEIEPIAFMDCKKLDMSLDVFRCCPEGMRNCDVHSSAFDNTNETMQRRLTSLFDWWNQQGCPQTLRTWDWDSSSDEDED